MFVPPKASAADVASATCRVLEGNGNALAHRGDQVSEGECRIERREQKRGQLAQLDARQVVGGGGKVADVLELGHSQEASVEGEAAAVIAAAKVLRHGRLGADEVSAVGANVGQSAQHA